MNATQAVPRWIKEQSKSTAGWILCQVGSGNEGQALDKRSPKEGQRVLKGAFCSLFSLLLNPLYPTLVPKADMHPALP
eukprot:1160232-Pelagomonas_calceolata.AAC.4